MYFPVRSSGEKNKGGQRITDLMNVWLDQHLSKLPQRCTPILGMDLNDRLGMHRVGDHDETACGQCSTTGEFASDRENHSSHNLRMTALKHHMCFVNTVVSAQAHLL